MVDIGTGRIDYGKIYTKSHGSFNGMAVDNAKKLFLLSTVSIGKIGDRDKMPEKTGILIREGISVEGLHACIKAIGKIRLENQVFMSLSNIGKACKEIVRLVKRIIPLEAGYTGTRNFMDIPVRKSVGVLIIINYSGGIVNLEQGVEFIGQQ